MTFHLPAWETQPLVSCHLLYKLQLTSCNKKNLVAMVSRGFLMICLEIFLCRGFIETSLILPKSAPYFLAFSGNRLFELPKVIRTMLCFKWGPGGGARCFPSYKAPGCVPSCSKKTMEHFLHCNPLRSYMKKLIKAPHLSSVMFPFQEHVERWSVSKEVVRH